MKAMRELEVLAYGGREFLSLMGTLGVKDLYGPGEEEAMMKRVAEGNVALILVEEGSRIPEVKRRRGEVYPIVLQLPPPSYLDEGKIKRFYVLKVKRMLGFALRL